MPIECSHGVHSIIHDNRMLTWGAFYCIFLKSSKHSDAKSAEISDPDSLSPLISADASFFHLSASSSNQAAPDRHTLSSSIGTGKQRQIPVTGQHLVYCIGI